MTKSKFLKLASITSILLAATAFQGAQAASSDDDESSMSPTQACLVAVETPEAYQLINVNYIRLAQITSDKTNFVSISMASNYNNLGTSSVNIKYPGAAEAKKGLLELRDKINFCRENLSQRNRTLAPKK